MKADPSAMFHDGLAHGELRYLRCRWCATSLPGFSVLCTSCGGADLDWELSSGNGRIHALGSSAVVELEEGFRIRAELAPAPAHQIWQGAPVRLEFASSSDGSARPVFRLTAA